MPPIKGLLTRWKFLCPGWGETASRAPFSRCVYPRASPVPPARLYSAHPGYQACARRRMGGAGGRNRGVSRCHGWGGRHMPILQTGTGLAGGSYV